jgi:LPXTG-motif cell wall-anchored protein
MKVQILRIANVSEKYIGTDFGADKYSIAEVSGDLVFVKMQGNFTKIVSGELDDTHKNDTAGTAAGEELVPKEEGGKSYVTYPFQVTKLDEPIKFCMYSGSMGKWIGYSITFSKATEGAQTITPSDIKMDENGANITAEDATDLVLTKETVGKIMQEGAPLTITNKTGVITFDGDAVSSAFAYLDGAVNFEMKDIKETNPLFADSDYAMVLDLSLTDAEGNNLFKEGGKGTAKITVPFTGEVPEGKTVKVFYITASGREEVEATYDRDAKTVTFTVSHFSQYGLEVADATKSPNTGDNSLLFVFVGLMLMSGVAFAATKKGLIK